MVSSRIWLKLADQPSAVVGMVVLFWRNCEVIWPTGGRLHMVLRGAVEGP
jgi:hypothetical protein